MQNRGKRRSRAVGRRCATFAIVIGITMGAVAAADRARAPTSGTSYIVEGRNTDDVERAVKATGALVTERLGIIRSVEAELTAEQRRQLEQSKAITRVYENRRTDSKRPRR